MYTSGTFSTNWIELPLNVPFWLQNTFLMIISRQKSFQDLHHTCTYLVVIYKRHINHCISSTRLVFNDQVLNCALPLLEPVSLDIGDFSCRWFALNVRSGRAIAAKNEGTVRMYSLKSPCTLKPSSARMECILLGQFWQTKNIYSSSSFWKSFKYWFLITCTNWAAWFTSVRYCSHQLLDLIVVEI